MVCDAALEGRPPVTVRDAVERVRVEGAGAGDETPVVARGPAPEDDGLPAVGEVVSVDDGSPLDVGPAPAEPRSVAGPVEPEPRPAGLDPASGPELAAIPFS